MDNDKNRCLFYVAPDGNDNWNGRLPNNGNNGADGPFATLRKAVEAVREYEKTPGRIILRGGNYYDVSVKLGSLDSGLAIEAMQGEKPVLYGGRRITGWKKEENSEFWFAELPEAANGEWDFRLLSVNGRMADRSRLPEKGTFKHLTEFDVPWLSTSEGGWKRKPTPDELTTLKYDEKDLGSWIDIRNAEMTIFHKWDESLAGIASHDCLNHTFRLSNPCGHPPGAFGYQGYIVWNIREGMTAPGQWYLDKTAGTVVYHPLPGEKMETAVVVAPTVFNILSFTEKMKGVRLKGITLAVTNTPLISGDYGAVRMTGAVQSLEGLENCLFSELTIENTAGHGIKLLGENRSVRIDGCDINHTGAGGILFYNYMKEQEDDNIQTVAPIEPSAGDPGKLDCDIVNNLIRHVGEIYPSAIAIASHHCNISHNEISHTSYSGICHVGGGARIEHNIVSRAMQVLNDGAAIYVTFCRDGIIRGNIVKDIQQREESDSTRNGIYLDEQTFGWIIEENLVENCTHPTMNHMAKGNTLRNNVFTSDSSLRMNFIRCKDYILEGNVLFSNDEVIFAGNPDAISGFENNRIFSKTGKYEEFHINDRYQHYDTVPLRKETGWIDTGKAGRRKTSPDR